MIINNTLQDLPGGTNTNIKLTIENRQSQNSVRGKVQKRYNALWASDRVYFVDVASTPSPLERDGLSSFAPKNVSPAEDVVVL